MGVRGSCKEHPSDPSLPSTLNPPATTSATVASLTHTRTCRSQTHQVCRQRSRTLRPSSTSFRHRRTSPSTRSPSSSKPSSPSTARTSFGYTSHRHRRKARAVNGERQSCATGHWSGKERPRQRRDGGSGTRACYREFPSLLEPFLHVG